MSPSVLGTSSLLPLPRAAGRGGWIQLQLLFLALGNVLAARRDPQLAGGEELPSAEEEPPKVWDLTDFPIPTPWSHLGSPSSAPAGLGKRDPSTFPREIPLLSQAEKNSHRKPPEIMVQLPK